VELDCGICRVRSWRKADRASLVKNANNRRIWETVRDRFPHPYTDEAARRWLGTVVGAEPELHFAIDIGDQAVGGIGLAPGVDVERFSAEIGYWLGEPYWGRGIATAALSVTVEHALKNLGYIRIFAIPFATNPASARVLEKTGFVKEGVMSRSAVKDGRVIAQLLYAVTRKSGDPPVEI